MEVRIAWLHVTAKDAAGKPYRLPVYKKSFEDEEYTIAAGTFPYQDTGVPAEEVEIVVINTAVMLAEVKN